MPYLWTICLVTAEGSPGWHFIPFNVLYGRRKYSAINISLYPMHYKGIELPLTATRYKTNHFLFFNFSNSPQNKSSRHNWVGFRNQLLVDPAKHLCQLLSHRGSAGSPNIVCMEEIFLEAFPLQCYLALQCLSLWSAQDPVMGFKLNTVEFLMTVQL